MNFLVHSFEVDSVTNGMSVCFGAFLCYLKHEICALFSGVDSDERYLLLHQRINKVGDIEGTRSGLFCSDSHHFMPHS